MSEALVKRIQSIPLSSKLNLQPFLHKFVANKIVLHTPRNQNTSFTTTRMYFSLGSKIMRYILYELCDLLMPPL